ncbi:MAG: hypothetical protein PHG89_10765 [Gallionella sp.]|nr:hypothetical protein [Gallionella sp.]
MTDFASLGIQVDTRQLNEGVNALDKLASKSNSAETATKSLTSATQLLSSAIKVAAEGFAAYKLGSLIQESTMLAARFETMGVVMKVAGNNAGYTAAEMEKYSKALQSSGISMLQSRDALTQLATANIDLAKASQIGRAAQDLAVVGNINSNEAMQRMIYGIKSGQIEVLRTIGLNVNFENGYKSLAASLGKTEAALTTQEKTMSRTNEVLKEATKYNGIYEDSMTTAGKAVHSLTGRWEDLKVKMGEAFLPTLTAAVFDLMDAVKAANAELDKAASSGVKERLGEGLLEVFRVVSETVLVLGANIAYVFTMIGNEIGGIAAQANAVLHGDFAAAKQIGKDMEQDANAARAAVDKFSESLLNRNKEIKKGASLSEEERIARGKEMRDQAAADQAATQALAAKAAAAKAAASAYKEHVKSAESYIASLKQETEQQGLDSVQKKMIEAANKAAVAPTEALRSKIMEAAGAYALEAQKAKENAEAKKLADEWAKKQKEAYANLVGSITTSNDALQSEIDSLRSHNEEIGLNKAQLDALVLARADNNIAMAEEKLATTELTADNVDYVSGLMEQVRLLREKRGLLGSGQMLQAAEDEVKASNDLWKSMWSTVEQTGKSVFIGLLSNGKSTMEGIGKAIKTSIIDLLYQMTMKKWLIQIEASISGTGGGGLMSAVAGGGSGGGGLLNMASNAGSAYSMFNGGMSVMGDYALGSMGIGSGVTQGAMLASQTGAFGLAGATATADALGGAASAVGGLTSALAAVPVWGWAALGAVALGSMFGGKGGGPKTNGEWATGIGDNGVLSDLNNQPGSSITMAYKSTDVKQISDMTAGTITSVLNSLGASSSGMKVGLYYNTDPHGTAPDNVGARLTDSHGNLIYNSTYDTGRGQGSAQLATEGKRMTMTAISEADVDPIFKAIVKGLGDIKTASTEMMDAAMAQIIDASTIKAYTKANPVADVMAQIAQNATGATGALERNNAAYAALIATYDGSAASTKNLAAATQNQYAMELSLIGQIQNALASTHDMFSASADNIKMSVMDNQTKYDYLRTQADSLYQQLEKATDPAQIQNLASKINADVNSAYGLLDATQQKSASDGTVDYLSKVDKLTQDRLNASQDAITKEHNDLAAKLTAKMDDAAQKLTAAAAALTAAASTPNPPVQVSVSAPTGSEVSVYGLNS